MSATREEVCQRVPLFARRNATRAKQQDKAYQVYLGVPDGLHAKGQWAIQLDLQQWTA